MADPSPTSTANTAAAAMSDNASAGSKRKRGRREGEGGSSVKSGGRTRKPGGIGRLFTVFLCCRSSTTADDDSQPAPRTVTQKRDPVPPRSISPLGKEPVAKAPQKDSGVAGGSGETLESEKISEKPKEELATVVAPPAAAAVAESVPPTVVPSPTAPVTEKASIFDAVENDLEVSEAEVPKAPQTLVTAPITVATQPPTPIVPPEAPIAPVVLQSEEALMTDTNTSDDTTAVIPGKREIEEDKEVVAVASPAEKEEVAGTNSSDDEAEEHVAHDSIPVDSATGKGRSWLLDPLRPEFVGKKCLVLDLDETLVHSSFKVRSSR